MSNSNRGGRRGFRDNKPKHSNKVEQSETDADDHNPLLSIFRNYSKELDAKHDRYEKIVKIGRDITIESKRIIFLMHTIDSKKNNIKTVLEEAEKRLQILINNNFLSIAKELGNLDAYQYLRSYSAGLQEFIEAYTFFEFLSGKTMSDWKALQKNLSYEIVSHRKNDKLTKIEVGEQNIDQSTEETETKVSNSLETMKVSCLIPPSEYMLGLADLTGEIMRRCINSLASSDIENCFLSCRVLKSFYTGYLGINLSRQKELNRKIYTLRQSLIKTENVMYNVRVRGGEAAIWGNVNDPYNSAEKHEDADEGYY